jgi:RNA polymerase sigma factor (sigma-70 family)
MATVGPRNERASDPERLIEEYGALMLATARRWSTSDQDAEDAFQRAAEKALRNRPSGGCDELRAWLRTTVKNEALAIVRQRHRVAAGGNAEMLEGPRMLGAPAVADTDLRAEQIERLRLGGQALRRLKPQEIRALQLRAEGYSYKEIATVTGWSATKVNRCVNEGQRAFERALDGIESGAECARLAADVDAFATGEGVGGEPAVLRAHLATCLACRARLRGVRGRATSGPRAA